MSMWSCSWREERGESHELARFDVRHVLSRHLVELQHGEERHSFQRSEGGRQIAAGGGPLRNSAVRVPM